jgi:hypothetical protein
MKFASPLILSILNELMMMMLLLLMMMMILKSFVEPGLTQRLTALYSTSRT